MISATLFGGPFEDDTVPSVRDIIKLSMICCNVSQRADH